MLGVGQQEDCGRFHGNMGAPPSSPGIRQGGVGQMPSQQAKMLHTVGARQMGCRVQGGIPTFYIISPLAPGLVIHCCLSVVGRSPGDPEKLGAVAWGPTPEIPVGSRSTHDPTPRQLPRATWKTLEGGWWHPLPLLPSGQQDIAYSWPPRARDHSLSPCRCPWTF